MNIYIKILFAVFLINLVLFIIWMLNNTNTTNSESSSKNRYKMTEELTEEIKNKNLN